MIDVERPFYLHHQRVHQPLDDRTERLAETLLVETTAAVWQITGILLLDGDVILWFADECSRRAVVRCDRGERGTRENERLTITWQFGACKWSALPNSWNGRARKERTRKHRVRKRSTYGQADVGDNQIAVRRERNELEIGRIVEQVTGLDGGRWRSESSGW